VRGSWGGALCRAVLHCAAPAASRGRQQVASNGWAPCISSPQPPQTPTPNHTHTPQVPDAAVAGARRAPRAAPRLPGRRLAARPAGAGALRARAARLAGIRLQRGGGGRADGAQPARGRAPAVGGGPGAARAGRRAARRRGRRRRRRRAAGRRAAAGRGLRAGRVQVGGAGLLRERAGGRRGALGWRGGRAAARGVPGPWGPTGGAACLSSRRPQDGDGGAQAAPPGGVRGGQGAAAGGAGGRGRRRGRRHVPRAGGAGVQLAGGRDAAQQPHRRPPAAEPLQVRSAGGCRWAASPGTAGRRSAQPQPQRRASAPCPARRPRRWISNPASRLHSPALHRQLLGLMQKLFLQLLAELRKLGATVVAASFHSITLCTGKRDLGAAVGYVKCAAWPAGCLPAWCPARCCGHRHNPLPACSPPMPPPHPPPTPPHPTPAGTCWRRSSGASSSCGWTWRRSAGGMRCSSATHTTGAAWRRSWASAWPPAWRPAPRRRATWRARRRRRAAWSRWSGARRAWQRAGAVLGPLCWGRSAGAALLVLLAVLQGHLAWPVQRPRSDPALTLPCPKPLPPCRYQWSLRDFLPEALQQPLVVALTEFIYNPWREARAARLEGASQGGSQAAKDARSAEELQVRPARLPACLPVLPPGACTGPAAGSAPPPLLTRSHTRRRALPRSWRCCAACWRARSRTGCCAWCPRRRAT
jgi:hypothetical protein